MSTKREEIDHLVRTAGGVISGSQPDGKQLRAGIGKKRFGKALPRAPEEKQQIRQRSEETLVTSQSAALWREATADSVVSQPESYL